MGLFILYTDYHSHSPYVGQLKAVLAHALPQWPIIDLLHDAPAFQPRLAAYLLAAFWSHLPLGSIVIGVVDPGVGTTRGVCWVEADGRHFVGPDNGLINQVAQRATAITWHEVLWQPQRLSASFHGRDWFAPLAVRLARGENFAQRTVVAAERIQPWPPDVAQIIYLDPYGNAYSGVRAEPLAPTATLVWRGHRLPRVRTFADVPPGAPLCYANSQGLLEIAVNGGSAQQALGLFLGAVVTLATS